MRHFDHGNNPARDQYAVDLSKKLLDVGNVVPDVRHHNRGKGGVTERQRSTIDDEVRQPCFNIGGDDAWAEVLQIA